MKQTDIHWDYLDDEKKEQYKQLTGRAELVIRHYLEENGNEAIQEVFGSWTILMLLGLSAQHGGWFTHRGYRAFLAEMRAMDALLDRITHDTVMQVADRYQALEEVKP